MAASRRRETGTARSIRGRIDSEINRNLVHLGLNLGETSSRQDTPEQRLAARSILIGLQLQKVSAPRIRRIRKGLRNTLTDGTDADRSKITTLASRLSAWYDSIPEERTDEPVDTDALLAELNAIVAAAEATSPAA